MSHFTSQGTGALAKIPVEQSVRVGNVAVGHGRRVAQRKRAFHLDSGSMAVQVPFRAVPWAKLRPPALAKKESEATLTILGWTFTLPSSRRQIAAMICGHGAYIVALAAWTSSGTGVVGVFRDRHVVSACALFPADMLTLRGMAVGAGLLGFCFNMLQNPPLKIPLYWGMVFLVINGSQTLRLYLSRQQAASTACLDTDAERECDMVRDFLAIEAFA